MADEDIRTDRLGEAGGTGEPGTGAEPPAAPGATPPADPWADAFAQLEASEPAAAAGTESGDGTEAVGDGAAAAAGDGIATEPGAAAGDALVGAGDGGGSLPPAEQGGGAGEYTPVTAEEAAEQITRLKADVRERAGDEVRRAFFERTDEHGRKLIRQSGGKLGATLQDPDIYRVDEATGVPAFYNPDTGKPFGGDNPRAQAKQWVDAYNEELREKFNEIVAKRQAELETEQAPVIQLLEFMSTYEKLDPVRRQMLDALLEDVEVYDASGAHIGYSTDLNAALARVNRQVAALQASRTVAPAAAELAVDPKAPTGPAVDMPATGGGGTQVRVPTSLAEAMEMQQDEELKKLQKK